MVQEKRISKNQPGKVQVARRSGPSRSSDVEVKIVRINNSPIGNIQVPSQDAKPIIWAVAAGFFTICVAIGASIFNNQKA